LNQRKNAQAEPLFTQVHEVRRRVLGPDHLDTTNALAALGIIRLCQRRYDEAESLLRESIRLLEKKNPDAWEIYNRETLLGLTLAGESKFPDAEALMIAGYEGLVKRNSRIPWASRVVVHQAGERIVRFYQQWGQPERAAEWRTRLAVDAPSGSVIASQE
jgi:hypothetical protein